MTRKQQPKWELPEPKDDGLLIPEVGDWSADKHHFLARYLDAFVAAMRNKNWESLHYVDLFAGAGLERLKSSRQLEWGSPLIAAQLRYPFERLHVCEKKKATSAALTQRLNAIRPGSQILCGDGNARVHEVVKAIPSRALSVAFLDPYGLHLDFDTVAALATKCMDLIIFFPDRLDALRNWRLVYREDPDSNLDRVLGKETGWREALDNAPGDRWAEILRAIYSNQIRSLGYNAPEIERISDSAGRPLYLLMFFSRDSAGVKIWRKVVLMKPDNQRSFDFGEFGPST